MRGQHTFASAGLHTLIKEGGRGNDKKVLSHGIIKNMSASPFVVYVGWTEERDGAGAIIDVDSTNGFPVESGESFGFDLRREGTRVKAPVQVFGSMAGSIRYVFE